MEGNPMTMDQLPGQDLIGLFVGVCLCTLIAAALIIVPTALAVWMFTH